MTKRSIFTILAFFTSIYTFAALPSFRHLSTEDGLASITVQAICQGADGDMWFATAEGVDRYDGYSFTHFAPDSLESKDALCLCAGNNGSVICGFDGAIATFSSANTHYYMLDQAGTVTAIVPFGDEESFLISAAKAVFLLNKGVLSPYSIMDEGGNTIHLSVMCASGNERITAISPELGVISINPENSIVRKIAHLPSGVTPKCIFTAQGKIWIGTEGQGLYSIDEESGALTRYTKSHDELQSDYVRSICQDSDGALWVGTMEGLSIIGRGGTRLLRNNSDDPSSLSHNSVRAIYRDSNNGMWLGTFFGGINYYHNDIFSFERIIPTPGTHTSEDNIISALEEDPADGSVWIGVGHNGVAQYYPSSKEFVRIPFANDPGRSYDVKAILPDHSRGKIWIGAKFAGFGYIDKSSGLFYRIDIPARDVNCIREKDARNLYLCTEQGLFIYDRDARKCQAVNLEGSKAIPSSIWRDSAGNIWAGPLLQVFRETPQNSLVPAEGWELPKTGGVYSLHESADGFIYISCPNGLLRYNPNDKSFRNYGPSSGLDETSPEIIGEDMNGRIWLGLSSGVCCFNPENESFHKFGQEHGFSGKWYTRKCSCTLLNGTFLLGSLDGIISFHPESLHESQVSPAPEISVIHTVSGKPHPLSESHSFPYDENTLSFSFVTHNYLSAGIESFSYTLEGYDKVWTTIDGTNQARYSMLPPGKYTLRVRASNADGVPSVEEASYSFTVRSDLIHSPLFLTLILLVLISLIICILVQIRKARKKALKESSDKQKIESILQEIKKPLEMISNPVIDGSKDDWLREQLRNLGSNAWEIQNLVGSIEEFVKGDKKDKTQDIAEDTKDQMENKAFLRKAESVIAVNLSNPSFDAEDFAREMGVSRSALYMKMKIAAEMSPMELFMESRWKYACRLLRETQKSIAEIAEDTGFTSASYFARSFKKRFGSMPSLYRKQKTETV